MMQGSDLKAIRKSLGLSQKSMADALGITETYVGMMERGVKRIERRTDLAVRYLSEHPDEVKLEATPSHGAVDVASTRSEG